MTNKTMSGATSAFVRWMKFNLVGAIGICIQLTALAVLHSCIGMNYLLATALAVEITVIHNFVWHERFTWAERAAGSHLLRLAKFNLSTGAFSIAGNIFFTKLLVDSGLPYLAANTVSIALCSIINFLLNDRLVFTASRRVDRSDALAQD